MKYIVTGAAGFIGYHTAKQILENGDSVIAIDNINDFYDTKLKMKRINSLKKFNDFSLENIDLTSKSNVLNLNKKVSNINAIIHLAAFAGVRTSIIDPWAYQDNNVNATLNLLELCKANNIKNFTLASTSSVYGDNKNIPTKETDISSFPLSPYAASKISAELLTYTYHYHFNINAAVLRFFTVYGSFGRPDMVIFKFLKSIIDDDPITIYGDGEQTRDFTYVSDVANALIKSTNSKRYEIYNVGGGNAITVNELVSVIEKFLNKKARIKYIDRDPSDIEHSLADISKIQSLLNWTPKYNIESGVKKTGEWFLDNLDFISSIKLQD